MKESLSFGFLNVTDRQENKFQRIQAHKAFVESCTFSKDGRLLATCSGDKTVKIWRVWDSSLLSLFTGHQGTVWDCDFSSDSSLVCSCSSDKTALVWEPAECRELAKRKHKETVWVCRFCPGSTQSLASCSSDYKILIWNYAEDFVVRLIEGARNVIEDISFSPSDGSTLAACSRDKNVYLWKNYLSQPLEKLEPTVLQGHTGRVNSCSFSPLSDNVLVSCGSDLKVIVWDTVGEVKLHLMSGHYNAIWKCTFGLYGGHLLLATCSSDRSLRIWDPMSGCELKKFVNLDSYLDPRAQLFCCAFSSNDTRLAVTSLEGGLYIARLDDIIDDVIELLE